MNLFGGIDCFLITCSEAKFYLEVVVKQCVNPASIYVKCALYGKTNYTKFEYVFQQSETVRSEGRESNADTSLYTGVVARNASHLGFKVLAMQVCYTVNAIAGGYESIRMAIWFTSPAINSK